MADGPLNSSVIGQSVALCPECCGACLDGGPCQRCGWSPELRRPPTPTFNHTRGDGPFDPCAKCAALMSPVSLAKAYRTALADIVDGWQAGGDTFAHAMNAAERLLNATEVNPASRDGVPPSTAVAPTGPGGGRAETPAAGVPAGLSESDRLYEEVKQAERAYREAANRWTAAMCALPAGGQIGRAP